LENKLKQKKYWAFVIFQENHLHLIPLGFYPNDIIVKYYFSGSLLFLKENIYYCLNQ